MPDVCLTAKRFEWYYAYKETTINLKYVLVSLTFTYTTLYVLDGSAYIRYRVSLRVVFVVIGSQTLRMIIESFACIDSVIICYPYHFDQAFDAESPAFDLAFLVKYVLVCCELEELLFKDARNVCKM